MFVKWGAYSLVGFFCVAAAACSSLADDDTGSSEAAVVGDMCGANLRKVGVDLACSYHPAVYAEFDTQSELTQWISSSGVLLQEAENGLDEVNCTYTTKNNACAWHVDTDVGDVSIHPLGAPVQRWAPCVSPAPGLPVTQPADLGCPDARTLAPAGQPSVTDYIFPLPDHWGADINLTNPQALPTALAAFCAEQVNHDIGLDLADACDAVPPTTASAHGTCCVRSGTTTTSTSTSTGSTTTTTASSTTSTTMTTTVTSTSTR